MTGQEIYVALLRGVNVGGSKIVPMAELKKVFGKSGFSNVQTYIQSGNVVFTSGKKSTVEIREIIEASIKSRFMFEVSVMVLGVGNFKRSSREIHSMKTN